MVIVDEIKITQLRSYWTMNVSPDVQKALECIAVSEDKSTVEILAILVRQCVEQKARNLLVSKVDEKLDEALGQLADTIHNNGKIGGRTK